MDETHEDLMSRALLLEDGAPQGDTELEDEATEHGPLKGHPPPLPYPAQGTSCAEKEAPKRPAPSARQRKREAVVAMLADPESAVFSDRAIAQSCGVNHRTVATLRRKRTAAGSSPSSAESEGSVYRRGRDGRLLDVSGLRARAGRVSPPPPPRPSSLGQDLCNRDGEGNAMPSGRPPWSQPPRGPVGALPLEVADACVEWLCEALALPEHFEAVDPAVGDGVWVTALRKHRPEALVSRFDTDPSARGLGGSRRTGGAGGTRPGEAHRVADWLTWQPSRFAERSSWDLCLGTRPQQRSFASWLEASLSRATTVALLETEAVLGEDGPYLRGRRQPAWVVKLINKTPSASNSSAARSSEPLLLLVWSGASCQTRFDWLEV
jgi:hypothetical protein